MPNDDAPNKEAAPQNSGAGGHFDAFATSFRAAVSAIVAVLACDGFGLHQSAWAAISAVIVTQPGLHPSVRASLLRVAANLIGAFLGAAVSSLLGHSLAALGVGILLTGLVCHFSRLDDALRPAFAALVIVMFLNPDGAWIESLERVLAVLAGCAASLFTGAMFGLFATGFRTRSSPEKPAAESTE